MNMQKLVFVIGATATGKTHFIKEHFLEKGVSVIDIYDYQKMAYDEAGYKDTIPFQAQFRCLKRAYEMHLHAIIGELEKGYDVVAEQTWFKAKRRIAYIDEIRQVCGDDVKIIVYVMHPSDRRWAENIKLRKLSGSLDSFKEQAESMEFPNQVEGFQEIYEVIDDAIVLRMDEPKDGIVEQARRELQEEGERIKKENEEIQKRKELLESMKARRFWHYCESCNRKEYITAKEAYDAGWKYPPDMGKFGFLGPRICGECSVKDTLYWKVNTEKKVPIPVVVDVLLTPEERITWNRIKAEPASLLKFEDH